MLGPPRLLTLLIAGLVVVAGVGVVAWSQYEPAPQGAPVAGALAPAPLPPADGILWQKLTAEQKTALQPLAEQWPALSGAQQRKWVALTRNFRRLSPSERATLQSRMTEWAALTPAQRTQARMNFGKARRVSSSERRARWEQYQALTPEERQQLAAVRPKPPHGMAPALRPTPRGELAHPVRTGENRSLPINDNTLLPRPDEAETKSVPATDAPGW